VLGKKVSLRTTWMSLKTIQSMGYWPVSCERDSFAKGIFSLLQRRKTALPGWRGTETYLRREDNSRSHDTGHCNLCSRQQRQLCCL
jgi:hypothetical protein